MLCAGQRRGNKVGIHTEGKLDKRGSSQAFEEKHQQQPFGTPDFIIPNSQSN